MQASHAQLRKVFVDTEQPENEIKKISFFSASEGYVAFQNWIGYTNDSGRTFLRKEITATNVDYNGYYPNLTFLFYINGVKAFNRNTLIAYGHYGMVPAILYSADGGNSFKLVFHNQYNSLEPAGGVSDMVFPQDASVGYACDPDRILKTTDGGLTWFELRDDANSYFSNLEAVDNSTIFAFSTATYHTKGSSNKLLKTTNAGASWQNLAFPQTPTGRIDYAYFRTALKGWVSVSKNSEGYLYTTIDGGSSWTLVNDPVITPFGCLKMKFLDDNTGYALGGLFYTFKTTDGGKIWEVLPRDNAVEYLYFSHNDLFFQNNQQFWAGGATGLLELTTNGGGETLPGAFFKIDTTGVSPGGTVNLVNYSKTGYQYAWYVNDILIANSYNASYHHATYSARDSIKLVVTKGLYRDSVLKYQQFDVPAIPQVTSFDPTSGSTGTYITINGVNLSGVTSVTFGTTPAASFTIVSSTKITAIVASGSTGDVILGNPYGTFSLAGFIYFPPPTAAAPVVSSFTPESGLIGTTVTITGNNFNPVAANNIVRFGAVKATVLTATQTGIVCTVPAGAGYEPIYILNTGSHLAGRADKTFNVLFADSSNFTTHSFKSVVNFQLGEEKDPGFLAINDINEDGKPDLFCFGCDRTTFDTRSISVYPNTSSGGAISFGEKQNVASLPFWSQGRFFFNDVDGDGRQDIVAPTDQFYVNVFINQSTGGNISFAQPISLSTGDYQPISLLTDDLDGDGRPEIVSANFGSGRVGILRNTSTPGNASFAYRDTYQAASNVLLVASADIDGDGKKDIVSFNQESTTTSSISVFRNLSSPGTVTLSKTMDLAVEGYASGGGSDMSFADYDGDGKLDLIVFNHIDLSIFRNKSTPGVISFDTAIHHPTQGASTGPAVANLSGDAKPDLVTGSWIRNELALYRNLSVPGSINTDAAVSPESIQPYYTATGDFNLDGKSDIAICDANFNNISILKNDIGAEIPVASCQGLYTSLIADITGSSYQWQMNNGSGFADISDDLNFKGAKNNTLNIDQIPLAWNGNSFRCISGENKSSVFRLTVNPVLLPSVSITTADTVVCAYTIVTFTASLINPGDHPLHPTYRWKLNGLLTGDDSPTYSNGFLKNNDVVSVVVHTQDACAHLHLDTSNFIRMTVNGGRPSVSISTSSSDICEGVMAAFTATPVFGGTPSYQWQVNGINTGTDSPVFTTSSLVNNDVVKVVMIANGYCLSAAPVTSSGIRMTVNSFVTPSVTISTTSSFICPDELITFTPLPVNGGTSPLYNWYVNGIVTSTDTYFSNAMLKSGDDVQCILTSSLSCVTSATATSNSITLQDGICIPANNFSVKAIDISCLGKSDGKIVVQLQKDLNYTATLSGDNGYSRSDGFSGTSYNVDGLTAGRYQICFTVSDLPGYSQCFSVIVSEPPPLRVQTQFLPAEKSVTLLLEGGGDYFITLNGVTQQTSGSSATLNLQDGINLVEVATGHACQGLFSETFITGDKLSVFPNPAETTALLWIPGTGSRASVQIIEAATGSILRQIEATVGGDRLMKLDLSRYKPGVYIIRVKGTNVDDYVKLIKL